VYINADNIRPSAAQGEILIPETNPGEITTEFDARGFEGEFKCEWKM
jgi:hypothetical protein